MSTARILYKQYKALPKRLQNELKQLINTEEEELVEITCPSSKKPLVMVMLFV